MHANVNAPYTMGANVNAPFTNMAAPLTMGAYAPEPHFTAPTYGYGMPPVPVAQNDSFTLIVVLFILLIIVGAAYLPTC